VLSDSGGDAAVVADIAAAVEARDEDDREPILRLLAAVRDVLQND
jgi:hypothetical protein